MTESTLEFQVEMTCNNCVEKISQVLKNNGISKFDIDLNSQSVVVTTSESVTRVESILESTGKRTVIAGQAGLMAAVVMLGGTIGCSLNDGVRGVIRFSQINNDRCIIDGTVDGLAPKQKHGLAIHEAGDLSEGCSNVGNHYNPRNSRHGSPLNSADKRHVGDLGNIEADENGRANFKFSDKLIKVWDIIGRSVVVASNEDDLGEGLCNMSQINGNSGNPISCGIIARSSGLFENSKRICACDGVTLWDEKNVPLTGPKRNTKL